MESRIKEILAKIDQLSESLRKEQSRLAEKYGFGFKKRKIVFLEKFRQRNRTFRIPAWKYAIPQNVRHFLSIPFIYSMLIPVLILDAFVSLYHAAAFPLYRIPKVNRREYIVYDRQFLDYLNWIQKINCRYCTYVNGFLAYAVEIGARTERYWCPIKSAHKVVVHNAWYPDYADYGNPEEWKQKFNNPKAFECFQKECDEQDGEGEVGSRK